MKYFEPKISIAVDQYLEKKHMFGPMCQNGMLKSIFLLFLVCWCWLFYI